MHDMRTHIDIVFLVEWTVARQQNDTLHWSSYTFSVLCRLLFLLSGHCELGHRKEIAPG